MTDSTCSTTAQLLLNIIKNFPLHNTIIVIYELMTEALSGNVINKQNSVLYYCKHDAKIIQCIKRHNSYVRHSHICLTREQFMRTYCIAFTTFLCFFDFLLSWPLLLWTETGASLIHRKRNKGWNGNRFDISWGGRDVNKWHTVSSTLNNSLNRVFLCKTNH